VTPRRTRSKIKAKSKQYMQYVDQLHEYLDDNGGKTQEVTL